MSRVSEIYDKQICTWNNTSRVGADLHEFHAWLRHDTHIHKSWHTHTQVMTHTYTSHDTHIHKSWHSHCTLNHCKSHDIRWRATKYTSLLQKMTYKDKGSHEFSAACMSICMTRSIHTYSHPISSFGLYILRWAKEPYKTDYFLQKRPITTPYAPMCVHKGGYGVATISGLLKMIGLFCRI